MHYNRQISISIYEKDKENVFRFTLKVYISLKLTNFMKMQGYYVTYDSSMQKADI